ncbi:hypothetical protein FRX31_021327 [Thalictrum thalictroides]|uniref:Uncharacterized protein n=1 Tax=Thalictrum thalictroides TaxID=46969 RepID=A0A7J6VXN4_THATH|nr:hypothetical protein FRX31_021327 [Thalictrum thalictroides]
MSIFPCVSWVPFLWGQIRRLFVQNGTVDILHEIIADILCRLPAECVFLCVHGNKPLAALTTTPSFIDMHLSRANPVIAFQYYSLCPDDDNKLKNSAREVNVYFTDEVNMKMITKSINIDFGNAGHKKACLPFLYGSYNGFLLIINLRSGSELSIWNPSTQEQVTVFASHTG